MSGRCFVIAEAGINHGGNLNKAIELVDAALYAGADAVKFQLYDIDSFVANPNLLPDDIKPYAQQYNLLKQNSISYDDFERIYNYGKQKGIIVFASVFDFKSLDFVINLGVQYIKIASSDFSYFPLVLKAAKSFIPLILSSGFSTTQQIKRIYKKINRFNPDIIIMYAVPIYPPLPDNINLTRIKYLKYILGDIIGFSDHFPGYELAIASIPLGVRMIEKHIMIDGDNPVDKAVSLTPDRFKDMIKMIRNVEIAMTGREISQIEKMANYALRSAFAKHDILKGKKLKMDDIVFKRPGVGIRYEEIGHYINKKIKKDIKKGEIVLPDAFK